MALRWSYRARIEDGSCQFIDPLTLCPSLSLSPSSRRTVADSAQFYQPLSQKGIIVLSHWRCANQWESLFPLQHVGRGAPADVSRPRPAEHSLRSFLRPLCSLEGLRKEQSHFIAILGAVQQRRNYDITDLLWRFLITLSLHVQSCSSICPGCTVPCFLFCFFCPWIYEPGSAESVCGCP